jgi:dCTP deaminase
MSEPWNDWIPGVLSAQQMRQLCEKGYLLNVDLKANPKALDHSSIDLHLTSDGYRLLEGSIKPNGGAYLHLLKKAALLESLVPDDGIFILKAKNTYLFKLHESLRDLHSSEIYGQATAKSSVGRVDVLARLVVDGMDGYEGFRPGVLSTGTGEMFLEITPITFRVAVKAGIPLSQLRLFYGKPEDSEVRGKELWKSVLLGGTRSDGTLSVDLTPTTIGSESASAFRAGGMQADPEHDYEPIRLWKHDAEKPDPRKFWTLQTADEAQRLKIAKGSFYILRSLEHIALPKAIAVYCRAIDETIGEMRIHYAGFVHPFFGTNRSDGKRGTPLMFEVRGHDVDVNLLHGEKMARLTFYRMSEDAVGGAGEYNDQTLELSVFFGKWK